MTGRTFNGVTECLTGKYTPQGNILWTRINPGYVMGGNYESLDDSGYVYIAGTYSDFGGIIGYFGTLKYDNNGNLKWFSKYRYQNRISYGACVKSDIKGNCYVSGMIDNNNNNNYISGLLKCDYKGDSIWVKVFGDSLMETGGFSNFYFDDNGNIYVSSIYFLKYDSDGNLLWSDTIHIACLLLFIRVITYIVSAEEHQACLLMNVIAETENLLVKLFIPNIHGQTIYNHVRILFI